MEAIVLQRHSYAHLLAQSLQRFVDAHIQLWTWPWLDTGFYYDVLFSEGVAFGEEACKELTKQIRQIAKEPQTFVRFECDISEGYAINSLTNQHLKNELLDKFKEQGEKTISYYLNVVPRAVLDNVQRAADGYQAMYQEVTEYFREKNVITQDQAVVFLDLCAWPHVSSTKEELNGDGMKLEKIAGAYRQADEKNAMMTRIYGLAFENKEALQTYETMMEEARKRDHRVLGKQLKIFSISDLVGAWFPLMHPNGMVIRKEVEDYLRSLHRDRWYQRVWTPHLAKVDLYKLSGHYEHYKENFQVKGKEEDFMVKPMNCPHHMQIFDANQFSYRDMPVRYFEPATVYRDEKSWQLSGLTRVRAITQDDGHLFCRVSQIWEEVKTIVHIIKEFFTTLGMINDYRVSLSVRGEWEEYLGTTDVWEKAEKALQDAADEMSLPYKRIPGEAAFYGPKLDFMFKDAIGRERQLSTIQCDFNLPERFDLHYTNEQGEPERPVVIHRAVSWSLERFMGVMIEHFAWAFPVRLAPVQVKVITISNTFDTYGHEVVTQLRNRTIRAEFDTSDDSLNKKIRNAEHFKIPYILVIGEKEMTAWTVNVRVYKTKEQFEISTQEFVEKIVKEYTERSL